MREPGEQWCLKCKYLEERSQPIELSDRIISITYCPLNECMYFDFDEIPESELVDDCATRRAK